jgi:single-stranded-DNA-specific exonuclease
MKRNWIVNRTNPEFLGYISKTASISPVLAQVLINRGMKDVDAIREFIKPSVNDLHDPFLLPDMQDAVSRIKTAVNNNETVFVYGDYDADGTTATAVLIIALSKLGLKMYYHIPHRISEGYGLSKVGIEKARECGAGLIITVDCGITSEEEVKMARSMDMDVIITDHHEPQDKLPDAVAVIDPHRADSQYPFKYLAGVGVAFKLVQALTGAYGNTPLPWVEGLLDIVALGTIADSVPLTGENRVFVTLGISVINNGPARIGIEALKEIAGIDKQLSSGHLSFTLIPRINAAGRLDDASEVVRLFVTEDMGVARGIAGLLDEQNRKRKNIEGEVLQSALKMIDKDNVGNAIVLSSPDWHPGVIGIVASRLVDTFYRPVFLFSEKDSVAKGSARGIPPFHLYQAIEECSDLMLSFGGHRQAAGLRMSADNLPLFRERMNNIVNDKLSEEDRTPVMEIDAAVQLSDLNFKLVEELSLLEPFGFSNREPVFGAKDVRIINHRIVGNNHLKMQLKQKNMHIDSIGFNLGDEFGSMENVLSLDIAFVPDINEWNGTRNLQLNLKAIRPSV